MKFIYEYRTSDNVRHNGVVAASNREAAFAALKAQGIRPGFLAEAPGFFNKLFGKGKRWLVIAVLGVAVVVAALVIHSNTRTIRTIEQSQEAFDSPLRRQIIGDAAVIEKGIRTGWADVFALEGDRFLASFAIPGVPAAVRTTTEEELGKALKSGEAESFPLQTKSTHLSLEERQILAIVAGMKSELRAYLTAGGSLASYGKRLVARQEAEIGYCNRAKMELETLSKSAASEQEILEFWEKKNDELRNLGIRLIPMPD